MHEIRNYPYPQLHLLALQSLNPSRHATAVRESYEVSLSLNMFNILEIPLSDTEALVLSGRSSLSEKADV